MQCHRCMEHSLHLAVSHILSCVSPAPAAKKTSTGIDNEDDELSADDASADDNGRVIPGALRKMLELIKQVSRIDCNYLTYQTIS